MVKLRFQQILTRLRNEQENELKLINNLLGEIARIIRQRESRAPEVERLRELPQDFIASLGRKVSTHR